MNALIKVSHSPGRQRGASPEQQSLRQFSPRNRCNPCCYADRMRGRNPPEGLDGSLARIVIELLHGRRTEGHVRAVLGIGIRSRRLKHDEIPGPVVSGAAGIIYLSVANLGSII